MGEFSYGKAISDSFRLVFNNLYILVPLLISSAVGMIVSLLFSGIFNPANMNMKYLLNHLSLLIYIPLAFIIMMAISYFSYGWFFALIGQIIKKGKASLSEELKNAWRKGWNYFLVTLLVVVAMFVLVLILIMLLALSGIIAFGSGILGGIFTAIVILLFTVALVISILAVVHTIPIISIETLGPIQTIKNSFYHFNNNRLHTLAVLGIIILFMIPTMIIMYAILFLSIGSFSNVQLMEYMYTYPVRYSIISIISGLPVLLMSGWVYAFLAISYIRKKKSSKEQA